MNSKNLFPILFFFLFLSFVFAQETSTYEEKYETSSNSKSADGLSIREKRQTKGEQKGSPYMNESFLDATINGTPHKVRYNAHKDEMEYEGNNANPVVYFGVIGETEIIFTSINKKYFYANYKDNKGYALGYLVELKKGNQFSLYKREKKTFTPGIAPKTSYDRKYPDEYRSVKDEFYMKINEGEILKIPGNKKKFATLLGEKGNDALNYIKEKNISLTDENSLKQLFQYLDSNQ